MNHLNTPLYFVYNSLYWFLSEKPIMASSKPTRKEALLLAWFAHDGNLFAPGTKEHDGIEYHTYVYDKLILMYFSGKVEETRGFLTILHDAEKTFVMSVLRLILDLIDRIIENTSALVLPTGGGSTEKLKRAHVPMLVTLVELILQARGRTLHVAPASVSIDDAHDAVIIAICYYEADAL